jgi:hypothetical protein
MPRVYHRCEIAVDHLPSRMIAYRRYRCAVVGSISEYATFEQLGEHNGWSVFYVDRQREFEKERRG